MVFSGRKYDFLFFAEEIEFRMHSVKLEKLQLEKPPI